MSGCFSWAFTESANRKQAADIAKADRRIGFLSVNEACVSHWRHYSLLSSPHQVQTGTVGVPSVKQTRTMIGEHRIFKSPGARCWAPIIVMLHPIHDDPRARKFLFWLRPPERIRTLKGSLSAPAQIIGIWREQEGGATTAAGCRQPEISEATFCIDRASRGLEVSDAKGLKALEVEHATSAHVPVIGSD